jgi:hypothetical protein
VVEQVFEIPPGYVQFMHINSPARIAKVGAWFGPQHMPVLKLSKL